MTWAGHLLGQRCITPTTKNQIKHNARTTLLTGTLARWCGPIEITGATAATEWRLANVRKMGYQKSDPRQSSNTHIHTQKRRKGHLVPKESEREIEQRNSLWMCGTVLSWRWPAGQMLYARRNNWDLHPAHTHTLSQSIKQRPRVSYTTTQDRTLVVEMLNPTRQSSLGDGRFE